MTSEAKRIKDHAEQLGALGHAARLSILRYIVQGDPEGTPAGDIQAKLEIPASTLSHHLDRLASAGLIVARREGTFIYYRAHYAQLRLLTDFLWEDCCKRGQAGTAGGGGACC